MGLTIMTCIYLTLLRVAGSSFIARIDDAPPVVCSMFHYRPPSVHRNIDVHHLIVDPSSCGSSPGTENLDNSAAWMEICGLLDLIIFHVSPLVMHHVWAACDREWLQVVTGGLRMTRRYYYHR
ncbi:hypothetical protein J3A83DRAFT_1826321 [Scleroderma citrinum]